MAIGVQWQLCTLMSFDGSDQDVVFAFLWVCVVNLHLASKCPVSCIMNQFEIFGTSSLRCGEALYGPSWLLIFDSDQNGWLRSVEQTPHSQLPQSVHLHLHLGADAYIRTLASHFVKNTAVFLQSKGD